MKFGGALGSNLNKRCQIWTKSFISPILSFFSYASVTLLLWGIKWHLSPSHSPIKSWGSAQGLGLLDMLNKTLLSPEGLAWQLSLQWRSFVQLPPANTMAAFQTGRLTAVTWNLTEQHGGKETNLASLTAQHFMPAQDQQAFPVLF